MAFLGFMSAKEKDEERKKKLAAMVEQQQQPPSAAERIMVHQAQRKAGQMTGSDIATMWEKSQQLKKKKVK